MTPAINNIDDYAYHDPEGEYISINRDNIHIVFDEAIDIMRESDLEGERMFINYINDTDERQVRSENTQQEDRVDIVNRTGNMIRNGYFVNQIKLPIDPLLTDLADIVKKHVKTGDIIDRNRIGRILDEELGSVISKDNNKELYALSNGIYYYLLNGENHSIQFKDLLRIMVEFIKTRDEDILDDFIMDLNCYIVSNT